MGLQPAHSKLNFMPLAVTVSLALSCILTNQSSHKMKRRRSRSAFYHYSQVFFVTRAIKCTLGKGWSFTASSHCAQCNSLVYPSPSLGRPQTRGSQVTAWSGRCGSAPIHANTGSQWRCWQCKLWHIASQWLITGSFRIGREKEEEFTDLLSSVLPTRAKCKETRGA